MGSSLYHRGYIFYTYVSGFLLLHFATEKVNMILTCRSKRNQDHCENYRGGYTATGALNIPAKGEFFHDRPKMVEKKPDYIIYFNNEMRITKLNSMFFLRYLFYF